MLGISFYRFIHSLFASFCLFLGKLCWLLILRAVVVSSRTIGMPGCSSRVFYDVVRDAIRAMLYFLFFLMPSSAALRENNL